MSRKRRNTKSLNLALYYYVCQVVTYIEKSNAFINKLKEEEQEQKEKKQETLIPSRPLQPMLKNEEQTTNSKWV